MVDSRPHVDSEDRCVRTVMFSDVVDSTALIEWRGDAAWLALIDHHVRTVSTVAARRGGEVAVFTGDGLLVVFDDAGLGASCALQLQRAFAVQDELPVRLGIHHGPVLALGEDRYVGLTVHIASRLTALSGAGEVTMSNECYRAARAATPLPACSPHLAELRGVREPHLVHTWKPVSDPWLR